MATFPTNPQRDDLKERQIRAMVTQTEIDNITPDMRSYERSEKVGSRFKLITKTMKILSSIVCGLILSLSASFAKDPVNTECPVKGKAVTAQSKVAEVEVTFCCKKCKATFDKDVLAGLQKFATAEDGKCPISGKPVDADQKSTVSVGVCCGGCQKKVESEPKKHLAKVK
jgi:endogenous inhibitor of DNA gyrase (YacG/DUF329 family)